MDSAVQHAEANVNPARGEVRQVQGTSNGSKKIQRSGSMEEMCFAMSWNHQYVNFWEGLKLLAHGKFSSWRQNEGLQRVVKEVKGAGHGESRKLDQHTQRQARTIIRSTAVSLAHSEFPTKRKNKGNPNAARSLFTPGRILLFSATASEQYIRECKIGKALSGRGDPGQSSRVQGAKGPRLCQVLVGREDLRIHAWQIPHQVTNMFGRGV